MSNEPNGAVPVTTMLNLDSAAVDTPLLGGMLEHDDSETTCALVRLVDTHIEPSYSPC